jgi:hypothetical protein
MNETLKTKLLRLSYNFIPAYRGAGGRITHIAGDFSEVRVRIPLNWRTRNYVGTIFGGSRFGAVDPIYMVMLIKKLGPEYVIWDKSARIEFKKSGKEELQAFFQLTDEEITKLRNELETAVAVEKTYTIDLKDSKGVTCAAIEKTVFIRKRRRS